MTQILWTSLFVFVHWMMVLVFEVSYFANIVVFRFLQKV